MVTCLQNLPVGYTKPLVALSTYLVFLDPLAGRLVGPTWSREGRCWQRGLQTLVGVLGGVG